ncbi:hypothetical protein [Mycobacterium phage Fezzik]|nr:hypothetical protein [Mycobacterium phage Fezzik]
MQGLRCLPVLVAGAGAAIVAMVAAMLQASVPCLKARMWVLVCAHVGYLLVCVLRRFPKRAPVQ